MPRCGGSDGHDDASLLVDDAQVHGLCMKIDSAVIFVLLIIPLFGILREVLMSIKSLLRTA
jgi:hypothetical protein